MAPQDLLFTSGSRVSLPQNAHAEQRMAPSQHAQQNAAIIGEKINKMISGKVQNMSIQLEPANLGKLNINIQMGQDQQASVQFLVQVGQTRELVEQALPRLRDMLASQGIALGDTQIDQQNSGSKEQNFGQQFSEQHKSQDKHNPISRSYTQMESMIQDTVTSTQDIQEDVHNPYQNNGRVKIDFYA